MRKKKVHSEEEPVYNKAEREEILVSMREASSRFYGMAVHTKCHPFIEMTGLMNEYITICQAAHAKGIDFTQSNTHTGQALPIAPHNVAYLAEKLNCIYGPSLLASPELRNALISVLLDGEFRLERIAIPKGAKAAERAKLRPGDFESRSAEEKWRIDRELGILDWDGTS
jgi:hypothetical protein